jgi:hypothetical protein
MSLLFSRIFYDFLIPGNAELFITMYQSQGNMGLTGIYMGINAHKNLVWYSLFVCSILSYFGYTFIGLIFFLLALIKYYFQISKWHKFISDSYEINCIFHH